MGLFTGDRARASDFRGLIMAWPADVPPDHWLICDGQELSRVTYAPLYAIIGDTYGNGDGSTTFNLPDLRGSVILGAGQKTRNYSKVLSPSLMDAAAETFEVGQSRKYGNAKPVTLTRNGVDTFGRLPRVSINAAVDGNGWIDVTSSYGAFLPNVGDKVVICEGDSVNFSNGIYFVIETQANTGASGLGRFRVSTTSGGSVAGSGNSGSVHWVRVDQSNTEGYSGRVSWSSSGDAWSLGTNAMPAVGDRIAVLYESSTSPNQGSIYTVQSINGNGGTTFYTGNLGSDSGTVGWVNLGQGAQAAQPYLNGTYYTIYEDADKIKLALTKEDALAGDNLTFEFAGTDSVTIAYTDTLTDWLEGDEGGHEEALLAARELPDHTHDTPQDDVYQIQTDRNEGSSDNGSSSDGDISSPVTGGVTGESNNTHNLMQPFVAMNWIIKT